jgi:hypothetical protein
MAFLGLALLARVALLSLLLTVTRGVYKKPWLLLNQVRE